LASRSKSFLVLFFKKELLVFTYFFNFLDGLGVTQKAAKNVSLRGPLQTTPAKRRSIIGACCRCLIRAQRSQSFWCFFSKKHALLLLLFIHLVC